MAYKYCTSLIFEFWQVPLNIEYGKLARLAAHKACEQCVSNQFGSSLYVECVAVAGLLTAVWDIYGMIGAEPTQDRLRRDARLVTVTVGVLVFFTLLLAVFTASALLLLPWLLWQITALTLALSDFLMYGQDPDDHRHTELLLIAFYFNNLLQVICVLLKLLLHCQQAS